MKYTELNFMSWTSPLSQSEEQRVVNTVQMIKNAVTSYDNLLDCRVEIFVQGSYANNTNVRQNSDVDICVMLTSTVFCDYVDGKTDNDYGYTEGVIEYRDYKNYIIDALKKKFGGAAITIGNKSIRIDANSYHVNADVVPAYQFRNYKIINSIDPAKYVEGIKFYAKDGTEIVNYPKGHIINGKKKNTDTNREFKKLVRIMKHIRNDMVDDGATDGDKISSFLIECLVWNVPNSIITNHNTWSDTVQEAIIFLWNSINSGDHEEWREVSEHLYLFQSDRKWKPEETKDFLYKMYDYMGFK